MDLMALYEKTFAALSTGGLQSIMEAAHEVMQLPIFLHDSAFNQLAASPNEKIGDYFWDLSLENGGFPRETIMLFYDQGFMQAASDSREPYYVDWGDCTVRPRIQGVVRVNGVVEGYITLLCPKEFCTADHMKATTLITNACAIEMERSKNRNLSENPLFKVFMHDLVKGRVRSREALDMWTHRLPASFRGAFRLFAVRTPAPNMAVVQKYLIDLLDSLHVRHIEMIENDLLCLLLYALDGRSAPDRAREELQVRLEGLQAKVGISDRFGDILQFGACMEQAAAALTSGMALDPESTLYFYEDYRFPFIMRTLAGQVSEANLLAPGIARLADYDRQYKTSYLETLERYVLENRNSKKTLEALGIHRNTLLYRLSKIEELLGISLEDGDTFAHYYISLYIRRMKNTARRQ